MRLLIFSINGLKFPQIIIRKMSKPSIAKGHVEWLSLYQSSSLHIGL
jgi:hypothetical protein